MTGLKRSGGQDGVSPLQLSATSQGPASGRHDVVAGLKPSAGHVVDAPSQPSGTSQTPADTRHTVPAGAGVCWQMPVTSQESVVQTFESSQSVSTSHVSHASPTPSPSRSNWSGLDTVGQLSSSTNNPDAKSRRIGSSNQPSSSRSLRKVRRNSGVTNENPALPGCRSGGSDAATR